MRRGILLIDDEPRFRRALVGALEEDGFQITQAARIDEGLELLQQRPDLKVILLDMDFGDIPGTGRDFLETLKQRPGSYRVIVHTGHDNLLSEDQAEELKVFAYLPKVTGYFSAAKGQTVSLNYLKFAIEQAFKDIESERLQKRMDDFRALWKMINEQQKGEAVLQEVCKRVLKQIGGYTCHIRRLDPSKGDYQLVAYAGPTGVHSIFRQNKKLDEVFSGEVARTGKFRIFQDIQNNHKFKKFKDDLLQGNVDTAGRDYLNTIGAAYILPIKTGLFDGKNHVDAILNVSGGEKNFFTEERMQLVHELMEPTTLTVSKHWLMEKREEILFDYTESNKLLVDVTAKLQQTNIEQVFATVLKGISKIIKPEMISLFLYNESTNKIENRAELVGGELRSNRDESYESGECLTGNVFGLKEPLVINKDPTKHKLYESRKEIDSLRLPSKKIKHYLAVPLITGDKVIGVIRSVNKKSSYYDDEYPNVSNSENCLLPRGFSHDCKIILGIIASHLAVAINNSEFAINNSELITKLNAKISQHKSLAMVGQRISANYGLDTENLLDLIVRETATVMTSAICMLFLINTENNRVELKRCHGIPLETLPSAYYDLGDGHTGTVAQDGTPVRKAVGDHEGKYDPEILAALRKKYGESTALTSFMIVPITIEHHSPIQKDRIIGVLKVINKMPADLLFDEDDLSLFYSFASQISVALVMSEHNKSVFRLVQGVGHEIDNSVNLIPKDARMAREELDSLNDEIEDARVIVSEHRKESLTELRSMIANIQRSAQESVDFALDLLGFSEKHFLVRTVLDIHHLLKPEIERFVVQPPTSVVNASEVNVKFDLCEEKLECSIYENPFIHAVRNIVANAYQAMEETPTCQFTVRTRLNLEVKTACIEFEDTGIGIEEAKLHRIYDSDFSERDGGNGLGLWLVRRSLLRMDAAISVKSKLNEGTTFTIELPLANA